MAAGERDPAVFAAREADWRQGAIVYQVLVDRFAPAADLAGKQHLYAAPRRLRDWHEMPAGGRYLADEGLWSHELEFWGGDLQSLRGRLDHVRALGANVLYLNPIHAAFSNHKYDASDYHAIAPEFGTLEDLDALLADAHAAGQRVVLDGVFNHMGRRAPRFLEAQADP